MGLAGCGRRNLLFVVSNTGEERGLNHHVVGCFFWAGNVLDVLVQDNALRNMPFETRPRPHETFVIRKAYRRLTARQQTADAI